MKTHLCVNIKGRKCVDGIKQCVYKTKDETISHTVANESIFLYFIIDAKYNRDVSTCNIPGSFMQTDMDDIISFQLTGPIATPL